MLKLDWQQTKKKETKSWVRRQRKLRLRIYNKKCTRVAYFRSTIFSYSLLAFLFAFGFTFTFTFTLAFDIALRLLGWLVAHALAPVQMNTNKKSVSSYNNKKKGAKVKANVRKLKDWTHDHHTSRQGVRETFQMKVTEMMKVTAVRAQTYCLYLKIFQSNPITKSASYRTLLLPWQSWPRDRGVKFHWMKLQWFLNLKLNFTNLLSNTPLLEQREDIVVK